MIFAGTGERVEVTVRSQSRLTYATGRAARRQVPEGKRRRACTAWPTFLGLIIPRFNEAGRARASLPLFACASKNG